MSKTKVFGALMLSILLLFAVMTLTACGGQASGGETAAPAANAKDAEYRVSVVDAKGNPYTSGVIVRFMKDGAQAAMEVVNENGTAAKTLEKGEYTVELMFTDSSAGYTYDTSSLTLTADKTELQISLAYSVAGEAVELYVSDSNHPAYKVGTCCTQVNLEPGKRNYFLYAPEEAGTYEISVVGEIEAFGCYGTPFFVQDNSIYQVEDNTFTVSYTADMVGETNQLVLGVDAGSAESCVIAVERTGDPAWTPEQEPYVIYQTTVELSPYTLPANATLKEFDLTASTDTYNLVLNPEDGFYHLDSNDGPLVLVYLGKDTKYMSCFKEVLTKTGVRKYFWDENGEFIRRESYDECLREYFEYMDEKEGVYPLTEDLKYIIQQRGDHGNWFKLDSNESLFRNDEGAPIPGINAEIAWLFMCAYIA